MVINTDWITPKDYWIWAETLEDITLSKSTGFHNPISKHRAEAILHYTESSSSNITIITETRSCTPSSKCRAVNCPFTQYGNIMECINADQFESLPDHTIPQSIFSPHKTLFYNFNFDGENSTSGSSIDGINFRFPTNPPLTEYKDFEGSNDMCPRRGCDHSTLTHCACTQVIDINDLPRDGAVELVLTNRDATSHLDGASHPVHLHGHYFYVLKVGYPVMDTNGHFVTVNDDIECVNKPRYHSCPYEFITVEKGERRKLKQVVQWRNVPADQNKAPNRSYAQKDTVIVPYGGYTVIRFTVDNPGWWFFHCHIEIHQLEGMAAVIKELQGMHLDFKVCNIPKYVRMYCTPCRVCNCTYAHTPASVCSCACMCAYECVCVAHKSHPHIHRRKVFYYNSSDEIPVCSHEVCEAMKNALCLM